MKTFYGNVKDEDGTTHKVKMVRFYNGYTTFASRVEYINKIRLFKRAVINKKLRKQTED